VRTVPSPTVTITIGVQRAVSGATRQSADVPEDLHKLIFHVASNPDVGRQLVPNFSCLLIELDHGVDRTTKLLSKFSIAQLKVIQPLLKIHKERLVFEEVQVHHPVGSASLLRSISSEISATVSRASIFSRGGRNLKSRCP